METGTSEPSSECVAQAAHQEAVRLARETMKQHAILTATKATSADILVYLEQRLEMVLALDTARFPVAKDGEVQRLKLLIAGLKKGGSNGREADAA